MPNYQHLTKIYLKAFNQKRRRKRRRKVKKGKRVKEGKVPKREGGVDNLVISKLLKFIF
jgi:hypothetical protein